MKTILTIIGLAAIWFERTIAAPVENFNNFNLNVNDQLAINLPNFFNFRAADTIEYTVLSAAVKIVSSNPMQITEFNPNCKALTSKFVVPDATSNSFTMICSKSEFYELNVDFITGKISSTRLLFSAKTLHSTMECMASGYMKSKNVYCLFCKYTDNNNNYYAAVIIDAGTTPKSLGFQKLDVTLITSYQFTEKIKVKSIEITTGQAMQNTEAFIIFDEPYPDVSTVLIDLKSKANSFFLFIDVKSADGSPINMQAVRINQPNSGMESQTSLYMRVMSYEVINKEVWIALQDTARLIQIWKCNLNTAQALGVVLNNCKNYKHSISIPFGTITIMNTGGSTGLIGYYNKPAKNCSFCILNQNNPTDIAESCKPIETRDEMDMDITDFRATSASTAFIVYMNNDKSRYLGIDRVDLSDPSTLKRKVADRFKTFSFEAAELNNRYYILSDSFIEVYDKIRDQEMLLLANVLLSDQRFSFDITSTHQGVKDFRYLNGTRVSKFVGPVARTFAFPNFIGFLNNLHRMPISRYFFTGNAIKFNMVAPNLDNFLLNAENTILLKDGKPWAPFAFFYSYGLSTFMSSTSNLVYANCIKRVTTQIIFDCQTSWNVDLDPKVNEVVIAQYENHMIMISITSAGKIIRFNKAKESPKSIALNMKTLSAAFKVFDSTVQIAIIVVDNNGKSAIRIIEISQYNINNVAPKPDITSYVAGTGQDSPGDFCPKSVAYEVDDVANLIVLNSCSTKDRRIIRFNLNFTATPTQLSNMFIKIPQFKQENLQMCPDSEAIIVAAPGTARAVGLGFFSYNNIMDLGLDDPNVNAKEIRKLLCLGEKAFAIGFFDPSDNFKVAVYYTRRYILASNRLHSIIEFPFGAINRVNYFDILGTEGGNTIVINVVTKLGTFFTTYMKTVNLNGPEVYVQSNTRTSVYDAEIRTSNNNVNENFNLVLNFAAQLNTVTAQGRQKGVVLNRQTYDVETLSIFNGPVFNFTLDVPDNNVVSMTPRMAKYIEWLDLAVADQNNWRYATQISEVAGLVLVLVQRNEISVINIKDIVNPTRSWDVELTDRCNLMSALDRSDTVISVFLSCSLKSEYRFMYYEISKSDTNKIFLLKRMSSINIRSTQISVCKSDSTDIFLLASVNEFMNLNIYKFNMKTVMDPDTNMVDFNWVWGAANGKLNIMT